MRMDWSKLKKDSIRENYEYQEVCSEVHKIRQMDNNNVVEGMWTVSDMSENISHGRVPSSSESLSSSQYEEWEDGGLSVTSHKTIRFEKHDGNGNDIELTFKREWKMANRYQKPLLYIRSDRWDANA